MKKTLKNIFKRLAIIFPIWLLIYKWPTNRNKQKNYFKYQIDKPYNIAHRGGAQLEP